MAKKDDGYFGYFCKVSLFNYYFREEKWREYSPLAEMTAQHVQDIRYIHTKKRTKHFIILHSYG